MTVLVEDQDRPLIWIGEEPAMEPERRCIFRPCVATWRHWHGGFPGGYDNPEDPEGAPIPFVGDDPEPGAIRDYNGAVLRSPATERLETSR